MFLVTVNKTRQLLHLSYIQRVKPVELQRGREDLKSMLLFGGSAIGAAGK